MATEDVAEEPTDEDVNGSEALGTGTNPKALSTNHAACEEDDWTCLPVNTS